jgi:hypothetical protein
MTSSSAGSESDDPLLERIFTDKDIFAIGDEHSDDALEQAVKVSSRFA